MSSSHRHLASTWGLTRKMAIDRRHLLGALGASVALGPLSAHGTIADQPVYLSAAKVGGRHKAVLLNERGHIQWSLDLPGRGHGGAFRPHSKECIVFARRPGQFALVVDQTTGLLVQSLIPPLGRHFYGHGCYSTDGRRLYTTENDYEGERGIIGLWDAADGYRRIGEYDSHGIGPHEALLMPDGHTLAIANGGIATHPETGRLKLNIPDMEPSLVLLDGRDGSLLSKHTPPRELHKLSLRHISVNDQGVLFAAAQFEGAQHETPPLLASLRSTQLRFHAAGKNVQAAMNNYCGSVSFDQSGRTLAVSCPRGNLITFWSQTGDFISSTILQDGCGLASLPSPKDFLATSGTGSVISSSPGSAKLIGPNPAHDVAWDNHIASNRLFRQ